MVRMSQRTAPGWGAIGTGNGARPRIAIWASPPKPPRRCWKSGGAFVPLRKGASRKAMGALAGSKSARPETIYMTEGIEDALTVAMVKPDLRVLAGYSLRNLGMILFPAAIATIGLARHELDW